METYEYTVKIKVTSTDTPEEVCRALTLMLLDNNYSQFIAQPPDITKYEKC